jgi:hypothetical protein
VARGAANDQEDGGGILAVSGAHWFAALLKRVQGLQLVEDLCQEDWAVVFFARRNHNKLWIGLAHFHHGSFASLQWFTATGKNELKRLLVGVEKREHLPVQCGIFRLY